MQEFTKFQKTRKSSNSLVETTFLKFLGPYIFFDRLKRRKPIPKPPREEISLSQAQAHARAIIVSAKDQALKIREALEQEKVKLEQREESLEEKEKDLRQKEERIDSKIADLEKVKKQEIEKLEKIASLSQEEARSSLLKKLDEELAGQQARRIKEAEEKVKEEAEKKAQEILVSTLQRIATEHVAEITSSTVTLPDEEMKGRIIGKEGRNIKALEAATGVDIIIDETPKVVTISSYDPVRREIAKVALEKLIADGRIQPTRIEEVVVKVKDEIDKIIHEAGEELVYKVGVTGLPREIVDLLGRFKFRTSYGQNMVEHTLEVVNIGKTLAAELKADVELVKIACLLHDLGKAISSEIEGPHAKVGADLARRCGVSERIVRTFEGHHTEDFPNLEAVIVYLADAISGARPGARLEDYEAYIQRVGELENIANSFPGVEESFAISAGREVRVIIKPVEIEEAQMVKLAHDISQRIHEQVAFPGEVKVTVVRETRATDVAKPKV